jgi:hippurate hydrolase
MDRRLTAVLAAAPLFLIAPTASGQDLSAAIKADMPALMELYRDLHSHPELSEQEVDTSAKLAERAKALGFSVTEKVGGTGVVAVLKNGPGPVVLIRADMDGLPVIEQTGLAFASTVRATSKEGIESGVMHACGHDTHMTAWVETAKLLTSMKDKWSGTLVMILQPAEETGKGARLMLEDGLFTRFPHPNYALAFHDAANFEAGKIAYTPGYALANVDSVDIVVKGVGGHGAYPQTAKDPIVLGAKIVMALQTLVSREQDPQDPAVVTVGSFRGGAKHNIIPDEATLLLTVRSYSDATRTKLLDGIRRIVRGEAIASGIPDDRMPVVTVKDEFTPSTFNPPAFAEKMGGLLTAHFGAARVTKAPAVMGGEDFGRFWRADNSIGSFIFWVGGVPADRMAKAAKGEITLPSLHSPFWAPEADKVIPTAAEAMTVLAMDLLKKK